MGRIAKIRGSLDGFRADEGGTATVEAVLWIPLYLLFFGLIIDAALLFHGQSKAQRIAHDINRLASVGYYTNSAGTVDTTAMKDAAEEQVRAHYANATATVNADADSFQTFITVPGSDLAIVGFLGAVIPTNITVSAAHLREI